MDGMTEAIEGLRRVDAALAETAVDLAVWLDQVTKCLRYLAEGDPDAAKDVLARIEEVAE